MPVFGICRGLQLINVALGGTLHQHLPEALGTAPLRGEGAEGSEAPADRYRIGGPAAICAGLMGVACGA